MRKQFLVILALASMALACDVGVRDAIFLKPTVPAILRESVPNVKVWTADENGVLRAATADLPEGAEIRVPLICERPHQSIELIDSRADGVKTPEPDT